MTEPTEQVPVVVRAHDREVVNGSGGVGGHNVVDEQIIIDGEKLDSVSLQNSENDLKNDLELNNNNGNDNDDIVHDLPTVDEYKASNPSIGGGNSSGDVIVQNKWFFIGIAVIIVFIIIIISISVSVNTSSGTVQSVSPPSSPSSDNNAEDTARFETFTKLVMNSDWSSPESLRDKFSPQTQAAYYIANHDTIDIDADEGNEPAIQLLQRYVLAVLYYSTNGKDWKNSYNFLSDEPECEWFNYIKHKNMDEFIQIGIVCDPDNNVYIEQIIIPSNNLQGTIPIEIRLLRTVKEINFYNNNIKGTIPVEIQELTSLSTLVLHQNLIHDKFPGWVGSMDELLVLSLGNNDITGTIPRAINGTKQLQALNCESCRLNGTLDHLYGMDQLNLIHLGRNRLSGSISDELFDSWTNLFEFDVGDNQLTGAVPKNLLTSELLMVADLHSNKFTGTVIPDDVDTTIIASDLRVLALHDNILSGSFEPWVYQLEQIQHLDLSYNMFTGTIPTKIGLLTGLKYLYLAVNPELEDGTIPTELGALTNMLDLSLQATNRIGPIPKYLGNLENLILLDLNENQLESVIPTELSQLTSLHYLLLRGNKLTGPVPESFELLSNLGIFLVDQNTNITSIPAYMCDPAILENLRILNVDCNNFDPNMVKCDCCQCCDTAAVEVPGDTCKVDTFFSNMDPTGEYQYVRQYYQLFDEDITTLVADVPHNETPTYTDTNNNEINDKYDNEDGIDPYSPNGYNPASPWEEVKDDKYSDFGDYEDEDYNDYDENQVLPDPIPDSVNNDIINRYPGTEP